MILMTVLPGAVLRAAVAQTSSYSGRGAPPMFGDFEAQRHWLEITTNLPLQEWYRGSHRYNHLGYWGLDYPPLTAYHSWLLGKFAKMVYPPLVSFEPLLHDNGTAVLSGINQSPATASHGIETPETVFWMRVFVLVSDALTFMLGVALLLKRRGEMISASPAIVLPWTASLLLITLNPSFIVVDHGHFQFNCVCHGFAVFGLYFLLSGGDDDDDDEGMKRERQQLQQDDARHEDDDDAPGSPSWWQQYALAPLAFASSFMYKQMALYYAPAYFSYFLSRTLLRGKWREFITVALAALAGICLPLAPFFIWGGGVDGLLTVLRRVFPVERGLFEDKVANFWCTLNLVVKLRERIERTTLLLLALVFTLCAVIPACLAVARLRRVEALEWGLFVCALGFFLFSFQVHEKSILLPLVPASLLVDRAPGFSFHFSAFALLSMAPLLLKDGVLLQALILLGIFAAATSGFYPDAFDVRALVPPHAMSETVRNYMGRTRLLWLVYAVPAMLIGMMCFAPPPARLPDLFVVLLEAYSFLGFSLAFIYGNLQLYRMVRVASFTQTREKKRE